MVEHWKQVSRFDGYGYVVQVSSRGNLRKRKLHEDTWFYPKQQRNKDGYPFVNLYFRPNMFRWSGTIHRLVAETFISNPENKPCTNHKDLNKENNCVENLEWVTVQENTVHGFKGLGSYVAKGEDTFHAKLKETQVVEIKELLKTTDLNCCQLGRFFNVDRKTIADIKNGKTWKHVK